MERLIIEFEIGDGFTYSSTVTFPVVYSSKEDFLIDLEDNVANQLAEYNKLKEQYNIAREKYTTSLNACISGKKKAPAVEEKKLKEIRYIFETSEEIYKELKDSTNVKIGGQIFNIENFLIDLEEGVFCSPCVYSLDEYFKQVEEYV